MYYRDKYKYAQRFQLFLVLILLVLTVLTIKVWTLTKNVDDCCTIDETTLAPGGGGSE